MPMSGKEAMSWIETALGNAEKRKAAKDNEQLAGAVNEARNILSNLPDDMPGAGAVAHALADLDQVAGELS